MSLKPAERAILEHAMLGLGAATIAGRTGVATTTVRKVLEEHGDDFGGWRAALDADSDMRPASHKQTGGTPAPTLHSVSSLLQRGANGDAKCKRLAKRIGEDMAALEVAVTAIEQKAAAAESKRREREAAAAEVQRLTAALAAAKKLAGGVAAAPPREDSAAIRAWAKDNGMELSAVGRVPAAIVAAYEEAQR